jgi:hypothetical protein
VQVADSTPDLGDGLAFDLQDQAEDAVGGRVLGSHVDDDAFAGDGLVARGVDHLLPVFTAHRDDCLLGRGVGLGHQL